MKQAISGENVVRATGAYSPGLRVGEFIFVSGQGPIDPGTGKITGRTIEEQTRQTLNNVKAVLLAAGASMDDCVKVAAHLQDINDFDRFNEVYSGFFKDPKPTRTTVQSVLSGILVEIDAIAHSPQSAPPG